MAELKDQVAVITGSTSGIGKGIAMHFAELGAKIVASGRNEKRGAAVVEQIRSKGGEASFHRTELARENDCIELIRFANKQYGGIDVLVNNAASTARGNIENTTAELWDMIMNINLRAPFLCMREAVKIMKERGGGSIVNIGSVNAYLGETKLTAYSVSKGGLMTLTKNAAAYLGRYKIRVNQINVGWTLTEGEKRVMREEGKSEQWIDEAIQTRPFGRMLLPRDVAHAAAYFASTESECVTGGVMDLEQYPVGARPVF